VHTSLEQNALLDCHWQYGFGQSGGFGRGGETSSLVGNAGKQNGA